MGLRTSLKLHLRFRRERREWLNQGGKISHEYKIVSDYNANAGTAKGHYFHQDLLVARLIAMDNPNRHLDVGSRFDGFVAHVASFRMIEVVDIRPMPPIGHENIQFVQSNLIDASELGLTDSLSCLNAIEHFGMGRYTDPIDINGHIKAIDNLVSLVAKNGKFYISFPIGMQDEVHFNAHRVFHPKSIFLISSIKSSMSLVRFDYVDDHGDLHCDCSVDDATGKNEFGCGIYTFVKK